MASAGPSDFDLSRDRQLHSDSAQDNQPGRETFAEMIAFARLAYALALLAFIKPPLAEKEILAKEKDVRQLREVGLFVAGSNHKLI